LASGQSTISGIEIKSDNRWALITALAKNKERLTSVLPAGVTAETLIAQELANDRSDMGELEAITAELMLPDLGLRKKWFERI